MRLSPTQKDAVLRGSPAGWRGAAEVGVQGSTMQALERKGLAETMWTKTAALGGYRRLVYKLTAAGAERQAQLGGTRCA